MASSSLSPASLPDINRPSTDASRLSLLCSLCQDIFRGPYIELPSLGADGPQNFPQSLEYLERSIQSGCHLCHLRWHDLDNEEKLMLVGCEKVTYGFWTFNSRTGLSFSYFPRHPSQSTTVVKSLLLIPADDITDFPNKKSPCIVDHSTGSPQTLTIARKWIENCQNNHALCKTLLPLSHDQFLPSRLIKLGEIDNLKPTLCTTENLPVTAKYVTLSHCWGGKVPLTLITSRIASFCDGINTSKLPKTFIDAMHVAVSIGIHYIWIDSLCIIQDSEDDDWAKEAATMADVYENSWCNIAATSAPDSSHGCFTERSANDVLPCSVEANWNVRPTQKYILTSFSLWDKSITKTELNTRGWIVQETILSQRVLHFARRQIFWECLELRACETYPDGIPNLSTKKISLNIKSNLGNYYTVQSPDFERYQLWANIVDHYLACKLTVPEKDRLVAISGVARRMIIEEDQYLAGLWRKILAHQLLWHIPLQSDGDLSRIANMPTWSWASLRRQARTRVPTERDFITKRIVAMVLRAGTETIGDVYSGEVKQGWLRCAGSLAKTVYHKQNELRSSTRRGLIGSNHEEYLGSTAARLYFDTHRPKDGSTIYCFTVEVDVSNRSKAGLLLVRKTEARGHYFRIGYFTIEPPRRWAAEHEMEGPFDTVRVVEDAGAFVGGFEELCKGSVLSDDDFEGPKGLGEQNVRETGFVHQAYMFGIL